jgi:cell division protein FtsZ
MVMPGLINLDFADVKTVMSEMGKAMMGTGEAEGEKRAIEAAEAAISNPLLDDVSMKGARGVLINITGGMDLTLFEVDEAANRIRNEVDPDANIIVGSTFEESLAGRMRVSVVATGIDVEEMVQPQPLSLVTGGMSTDPVQAPVSDNEDMPAAEPVRRPYLDVVGGGAAPMAGPAQPHPVSQPNASVETAEEMYAAPTQRAVGDEGMGFVAPQPMQPQAKRAPILTPEPAAPERAAEPAENGAKKRYRSVSLFERVTGGAWTRQERAEEPQPIENKEVLPVTESRPERLEPTLKPAVAEEPPVAPKPEKVEDDLLDIPAFLRRQAN